MLVLLSVLSFLGGLQPAFYCGRRSLLEHAKKNHPELDSRLHVLVCFVFFFEPRAVFGGGNLMSLS